MRVRPNRDEGLNITFIALNFLKTLGNLIFIFHLCHSSSVIMSTKSMENLDNAKKLKCQSLSRYKCQIRTCNSHIKRHCFSFAKWALNRYICTEIYIQMRVNTRNYYNGSCSFLFVGWERGGGDWGRRNTKRNSLQK